MCYIYIYIYISWSWDGNPMRQTHPHARNPRAEEPSKAAGPLGSAVMALNFHCTTPDSLSELSLEEKRSYQQCKGKSLRDPEEL